MHALQHARATAASRRDRTLPARVHNGASAPMITGPTQDAPPPSAAQRLARLCAQLLAQIGQIHFQRSALTGLVMLAALASVSRWAALGAAVASLTALSTARLLRLDGELARAGLLGYNASLTGAGLLSLYPPSARVWLYLIGVSALSTGLSARWLRWGRLPPLTLLFVLSMWGAAGLGRVLAEPLAAGGCDGNPAALWACGIGQISFVAGALPGLCIVAAITAVSWREGLWLGLGAAAGLLAARLPGAQAMSIGLMVNLALIAQGLTVFGRSVPARLLALGLGAGLCLLLGALRLPCFTLPFNLATWCLVLASKPVSGRTAPARSPRAAGSTSR